jgi:hypothetical protein
MSAGPPLKWFGARQHLLHDPQWEVWAGNPGAATEIPARAAAIASALAGDEAFRHGDVAGGGHLGPGPRPDEAGGGSLGLGPASVTDDAVSEECSAAQAPARHL